MKTNIASVSRIARVVFGAGLLALAFVGPKTPLGFIGLFPLAVGLVGYCPVYSVCPRLRREPDADTPAA